MAVRMGDVSGCPRSFEGAQASGFRFWCAGSDEDALTLGRSSRPCRKSQEARKKDAHTATVGDNLLSCSFVGESHLGYPRKSSEEASPSKHHSDLFCEASSKLL